MKKTGLPLEIFRNYLRKKGLKFTRERLIIFNGIISISKHFDADSLCEFLKGRNKNISRASVYRTIPLLVKSGLITESLRCNNKFSYELTFGRRHHDHMVCVKCGRIIEFYDARIEKLQNEVCKKRGFEPLRHKLGIKGYCRACLSKMRK